MKNFLSVQGIKLMNWFKEFLDRSEDDNDDMLCENEP